MKHTKIRDLQPGDCIKFAEISLMYMCLWNYSENLNYNEIGLITMYKRDEFVLNTRWYHSDCVDVLLTT